jgi:hypothetical protein
VSPDTNEWVVANSTLMPTRDGSKRAIVHFEVTIESFRKVAATLSHQFDIAVVDARTGQVVIDSRRPQQVGAPLGDPDDHRFRPIVATGASRGRHSVGDHPAAYQRLQRLPGNANDWYVVATARALVGALYGVSGWSIAIVAVALVLLPIAAVSFLAHHRVLVAYSLTDALTGIGTGRRGDPRGARIIAVCDAFTAMTSPRSYAAELTVAAAVAELQRAAGTQFDPAVVEAFSEMAAELVWPSDRPAVADQLDPVHDRG